MQPVCLGLRYLYPSRTVLRMDASTDDYYTYGNGHVEPEDVERWNRGYSDVGNGMVQCWETGVIRAASKSTNGAYRAELSNAVAGTVSMPYIDGMTTHTYSLTRTSRAFNRDWTNFDAETYGVRCSCGVESGCAYLTADEAHRETVHVFALNSHRRLPVAVFDGLIIDRY